MYQQKKRAKYWDTILSVCTSSNVDVMEGAATQSSALSGSPHDSSSSSSSNSSNLHNASTSSHVDVMEGAATQSSALSSSSHDSSSCRDSSNLHNASTSFHVDVMEGAAPDLSARNDSDSSESASSTFLSLMDHDYSMPLIPRSLFDHPSPMLLLMRKQAMLQKGKSLEDGSSSLSKPVSTFMEYKQIPKVVKESDWLIQEDYAILQVITEQQGLPLSLINLIPGHTPNWDLCAEAVNSVGRSYKSAQQCRARFLNVILSRELGLIDSCQKNENAKTENNCPMTTRQLLQQDNNSSFMALYQARNNFFQDLSKQRPKESTICGYPKEPKDNQNYRAMISTMMIDVLADNGINYHEPLNPMQLAEALTDRLTRKSKDCLNPVVKDSSELFDYFSDSGIRYVEPLDQKLYQYTETVNCAEVLDNLSDNEISCEEPLQEKQDLQPDMTINSTEIVVDKCESSLRPIQITSLHAECVAKERQYGQPDSPMNNAEVVEGMDNNRFSSSEPLISKQDYTPDLESKIEMYQDIEKII